MTTYNTARAVLGKSYVEHLWRQARIEDCIEEVEGLKGDCQAKGLLSRAKAYEAILAEMKNVREKTAAQR